ncbi:MAG TPA: response regulator transcription factor [Gemmatimonadaceae bacterium]|nr:response regulator transcription factor [Gemmatimonadaceae bacterium]
MAILLSVDSLESELVFERIIPQYSERGIRVIVVTPSATQSASRRLLARAMAAGADDFVVASSVQDELLLRLDAVTWRRRPPREQRGRPVFNIAVDRASRRLRHAGVQVALTPGEFKVFSCLARYAGQPVSRANIQQCLARSKSPTKNLVDVYILYLRRKLAELNCPCVIQTVRGVGYALVTAPAPATVRARQERSEADPANSLAS